MKNIINIFSSILLFSFFLNTANAQFRIRNDYFLQIGYEDYRILSFGEESTAQPNNGKYAIEYWPSADGLNFWKPWPTPGSANYILFLRNDHNVGIGTAGSSSYRLDVNGAIRCVGLNNNSDRRLKKNIQPLKNSLEIIGQLNPVSYDYDFTFDKDRGLNPNDFPESKAQTMMNDNELVIKDEDRMGFIAQEVQEVLPQLVSEDENGFLALNYIDLIPVLTEAIKEQQLKIEQLEKEISALKSLNTNINGAIISNNHSFLSSNTPNPFSSHTTLRFYISEDDLDKVAIMVIHDTNGKEVYSKQLETIVGEGTLELSTNSLSSGTYFYSLILNGQVVDSKTMLKAAQ